MSSVHDLVLNGDHGGVAGCGRNAALVVLVSTHHAEALKSPHCSPAVLDHPVVLSLVGAVADDQYPVVESGGGTLFGLVKHSSAVVLEAIEAGVDGNADWSNLSRGFLKSIFVSTGDVSEALHVGTNIGWVELARAVLCYIFVAGFGINTIVVLDVLEGIVHQTTLATVVSPFP